MQLNDVGYSCRKYGCHCIFEENHPALGNFIPRRLTGQPMPIRFGILTALFLATPSILSTNPAEALWSSAIGDEFLLASYGESALSSCVPFDLWEQLVSGYGLFGSAHGRVAVADFSQPSDLPRFYVVDLLSGQVLLQTWVAHGKNSGDRETVSFSNEVSSLKSSLGFYRIGERFLSPKHGPALMLDGLQPGLNDKAREREIILHGADYVSEEFIEKHGRCGRSHGCPALPRVQMETALELLVPGSLLYVAGIPQETH